MTTLPDFYKVEKIVGKKFVDGKALYRVKWLDWPSSTNTYEPLENLQQAIDLVNEFDEREKERASKVSVTTQHTETKPTPEKQHSRIRKQRATIVGKRPIIFLKTTQKIGTHWVFGNNLAKIIRKREGGCLQVEWDNGSGSLEPQNDVQHYEPELFEKFVANQKKN